MFHHVDAPEKIVHISDESFFEAINLDHPGLESVQKAVHNAQYEDAFTAFWQHFITRENPIDPLVQTPEDLATHLVANRELANVIATGGKHQFGQVVVDFSKPVDFNAWFGDQSKYGFHYLNWMECLPHAALETNDNRYLATYLDLIRQWYAVRDQIVGARPMSPVFYELGLSGRSRRFLFFLHTLRHLDRTDLLTPNDIRIFFKSLLGAGRWLALEQTTKGYRQGNWQLHGVWALLTIGFTLPEFQESEQFRTMGAEYLEQHMEQDYYEDGGHSERCYSYGTGCLKHLEESTLLAEANPDLLPPQRLNWREHTTRAFTWFLQMVGPGGAIPGINDGTFGNCANLLKRGAAFTGDTTFLWPIRHDCTASDPEPGKPNFESLHLPPSEFCVMRSGWDPNDTFLLVNHGHWPGGHSHMGILDFNLYAHGVPLAAEVSRFGPYDAPWDMFFRSEQAHNHIVVEGAESKRSQIRGEEICFGTTQSCDFFSGQHRAYEESAGVVIERRILFLKPWGVLISDAAGTTARRRSMHWYLHSPYPISRTQTHALAEQNNLGLLIVPENVQQLHYAQTGIDFDEEMVKQIPLYSGAAPDIDWPNRYFIALRGWDVPNPVTTFDVLLLPYKDKQPNATVSSIPCEIDGNAEHPLRPRVLEITANEKSLLVFHGAPGVTLSAQDITFSGQVAVIELASGRPSRAFVQDGESLTIAGSSIPLQRKGAEEIGL
ncbi:MAG: heparinase II/III family protein [bacterium]|nr:heparinase II/III family protein [bacterium]